MRPLLIFLFCSFLFLSVAGQDARTHPPCCDTLFRVCRYEVQYADSPGAFGMNKENILFHFHQPEGFLFTRTTENGISNWFVFRSGKKWRGWDADFISGEDYYSQEMRWLQVDGKGKPELLVWTFDDFGHHAATHGNERSHYNFYIFDIDSARCLLRINYVDYYWESDVDLGVTDIPLVDERLAIRTGLRQLEIINRSTKESVRTTDSAFFEDPPDTVYSVVLDSCPLPSGTYRLEKNAWIKTTHPLRLHSPMQTAPAHYPPWSWEFETRWWRLFWWRRLRF